MNKLTSQQIRTTWLNFFKSKGHMIEPGASLIPHNDPTLLWINAGVAALKKYFDGSEIPESKRITNVQKCIRTNDIENVGKTARHHTFFEMLGNFSIGDYFRNEVIPWAFDLLTNPQYFGIEKDKLEFFIEYGLITYEQISMENSEADSVDMVNSEYYSMLVNRVESYIELLKNDIKQRSRFRKIKK